MKRIGLMLASGRPEAVKTAEEAVRYLESRGARVLTETDLSSRLCSRTGESADTLDAILSLGGDGTMLRCVPYARRENAPIFGINLGQKGFLTGCEKENMHVGLDALLSGTLEREERTLLHVQVGENEYWGLNECALLRLSSPRLCHTRLYVNGQLACRSMADGVILATPTGSTGYALSAGGPMVMPAVSCLVFSAICPHALQYRPIVMPLNSHAEIVLYEDPEMEITLQVDGRTKCLLRAGDRVQITGGEETIGLLRSPGASFFEAVEDKLVRWNEG